MGDIELVIKIPEEIYDIVQNKLDFNGDLDKQSIKTLMLAIDNGIPRQKGNWVDGVCDRCGYDGGVEAEFGLANFCSGCGADMRGE